MNLEAKLEPVPLTDATLFYGADFLTADRAQALFEELYHSLNWRRDQIQLFGRPVAIPRLQAWYGDPGTDYRYSGLLLEPEPWTDSLRELKARIEAVSGNRFNSVLINLYRDGRDSVGWHSDNEPELGPQPVIASLSLGATRRFCLRHRQDKSMKRQFDLPGGSLLLMCGETQRHWLHALPKTRRVCGARINLSFRQIVSPAS